MIRLSILVYCYVLFGFCSHGTIFLTIIKTSYMTTPTLKILIVNMCVWFVKCHFVKLKIYNEPKLCVATNIHG